MRSMSFCNNRGTTPIYERHPRWSSTDTNHSYGPECRRRQRSGWSAVTGKLDVAYYNAAAHGRFIASNIMQDAVLWNREVPSGVYRLAINRNGQLDLYADVERADRKSTSRSWMRTGDVVKRVYFSNPSHDTQYRRWRREFRHKTAMIGKWHEIYRM